MRLHNDGTPSFTDNDTWGVSAELNWAFGPVTMTYLGSYRERSVTKAGRRISVCPPPLSACSMANIGRIPRELRFAFDNDGPLTGQVGGCISEKVRDPGPSSSTRPSFPARSPMAFAGSDDRRIQGGVRTAQL